VPFAVGVDVGGTFTDLFVVGGDGRSDVYKTPSTVPDPSDGFFTGLAGAAKDRGLSLGEFLRDVATIVHGTTITTNATLTGSGAKVGFITTEGFRDVLLMRRGLRERQYDNKHAPPAPIVPRHRILEVAERVAFDGSVVTPVDEDGVRAAAGAFRDEGVESVAVSYLFSFFDAAHEQRTRELLEEEMPGVYVTLSSEVLPQVRLYERNSTTALNAYVRPKLDRYLSRLREGLSERGFQGTLLIMQSNGGVMAPEVASRFAVNTLLSGPAAGPVAGLGVSRALGLENIITVDMGGTSFDASLVSKGEPDLTSEARLAGHLIATPSLDIHAVGAGGGSLAWVDAGGGLHVGPQSAGADPGPACYGRGTEPTVTDADLLLGYLDAEYFHGGALRLDRAAAEQAVAKVADRIGVGLLDAAAGIYDVVNANMADGLRIVSVQRGHDPREFALVVAGGAGPIHAAPLAAELEIPLTIIPRDASVFCAVGMLLSDLRHGYVRTFTGATDNLDARRVEAALDSMRDEALATLASEGIHRSAIELGFSADVRYVGQYSEVEVPLELNGAGVTEETLQDMVERFHRLHDGRFGYALPGSPTEVVNVRARSRGIRPKPDLGVTVAAAAADRALKGARDAYFDGRLCETRVYDALRLGAGTRIEGPAILEQPTTTIVVPPGHEIAVSDAGSFLLTAAGEDAGGLLSRLRGDA
jgi:N-methylhydantoinase A